MLPHAFTPITQTLPLGIRQAPLHRQRGLRIAVVGAGVSGLVSAWLLSRRHHVTVFEAAPRVGGHTNTVQVDERGGPVAVDTGFIVFNEPNYPGFVKLLDVLGVASEPSNMSFSVQSLRAGLEYRGSSLNTLFAQRANLLRPRVYSMLFDILRFNRRAVTDLEDATDDVTLGQYLEDARFGQAFVDDYIVPMGAALWSADPKDILEFPAKYFVDFFDNHAFLKIGQRPEWRVISGGSNQYLGPLTRPFADRIRTATPVRGIRRTTSGVRIATDAGTEWFDAVVLGVHSNQALRMLEDPSDEESEVLGAIPYQSNPTLLHRDTRVMPTEKRAWASWNYHVPERDQGAATVSYHMNRLQNLTSDQQYFVTLNREDEIRSDEVLEHIDYEHPVYTPYTRAAQRRRGEISGVKNTWYCGAYWGHGFHEDGVQSALSVGADFGLEI